MAPGTGDGRVPSATGIPLRTGLTPSTLNCIHKDKAKLPLAYGYDAGLPLTVFPGSDPTIASTQSSVGRVYSGYSCVLVPAPTPAPAKAARNLLRSTVPYRTD